MKRRSRLEVGGVLRVRPWSRRRRDRGRARTVADGRSGTGRATSAAAWEDLRARLRNTRWPPAPADAGWSLGADPAYLRDLVAYWADGFDWPAREAELAALPRHRVRLGAGDGLEVSFLHVPAVRSAASTADGRAPLPLLLAHGWPDSSWRYPKVVDLLTDPGAHGGDPDDAFDVVVPDMPGYGWSPLPPELELHTRDVAGAVGRADGRARPRHVRGGRRGHRQRGQPVPGPRPARPRRRRAPDGRRDPGLHRGPVDADAARARVPRPGRRLGRRPRARTRRCTGRSR